MKTIFINGKPSTARDWRCSDSGCNILLGKKHSKGVLIVRYKTFLAEISGNYNITIYCRGCGLPNSISNNVSGLLSLVNKLDT